VSFGIENLPYGSVLAPDGRRVAAARFENGVLDLGRIDADLFAGGNLDALLAAGRHEWDRVRAEVVQALEADRYPLVPVGDVTPVLAFTVADYVDFYASIHHATNAGRIFRPQGEALPPNWKHMPVGYHGRSGSVLASGTAIPRPAGMIAAGEFAPTRRLDFEAEVAFVVGPPGRRIPVDDADDHVFGVCLLNDWSARDIQAFETVPLGPFLGKSFATSVSPWITPLAALAGARRMTAPQPVAGHLRQDRDGFGLDLDLEIRVNGHLVSRPRFADMYWTYAQMLAHLTSNGATARTGDVFASGTVSGPERDQRGCLLELTWNGTEPLDLPDGTSRSWLADGDEVTISATAGAITLGEVTGRIVAGQ
jgi:fumarylacetoacetase